MSMGSGDRGPFTIPTTSGKKHKYMEITYFGKSPVIPIDPSTTIIIGANARIGTV